ncbi:hypothetical protein [Pseudoalteromonas atlantica]|uniref:hypothetical protein n=1 Tax=Pseudoalteromonas atlantica TaxID=288 RepID=UPI0037366E29
MPAILKREEIDFIFDLYHCVERDENNTDEVEPETEKLDSTQGINIYQPSYLT